MFEKDINQRLFTLVGTSFIKEIKVVPEVGSLPVISMKWFLLDSSVSQGDTNGKNMISIDLTLTISPVVKNTTKNLIGLYDTDGVFYHNSNL